MDDDSMTMDNFQIDSTLLLSRILCTVLTLTDPRKVAVLTWLERICADNMSDFTMIPNRLMNFSDIDPEIAGLGEFTVRKIQFLQKCLTNFTSTGNPDDDPRSWTRETFNAAFSNAPEDDANPYMGWGC